MDDEHHELLWNQPWDDLRLRLIAYAHKLLRQRKWRGEYSRTAPGGRDAEDFAQDVICDVLSGVRNWDPKRYPDIVSYLFSQLNSEISAAYTRAENRKEVRENPAHEGIHRDRDESFFWDLCDELSEEPELQKVVETMFSGITDRADIAQHLNFTAEQVTNLQKKLKRRVSRFMDKLQDEHAALTGGE